MYLAAHHEQPSWISSDNLAVWGHPIVTFDRRCGVVPHRALHALNRLLTRNCQRERRTPIGLSLCQRHTLVSSTLLGLQEQHDGEDKFDRGASERTDDRRCTQ